VITIRDLMPCVDDGLLVGWYVNEGRVGLRVSDLPM
jgi:hypothetical protein